MKKLNKVICLSLSAMMLAAAISGCGAKETTDAVQNETTGETAPSIYAQQGKCRNHAAFSTLKTIKQPL